MRSVGQARDRTLLSLLAVVLIVAGGGGLLAANGAVGEDLPHRTVFDNAAARYVGTHGAWLWPVFAVLGLAVALLALAWLAAQVRTDRASSLPVAAAPGTGSTTLVAGALTDAVAEQLAAVHGIDSADVRLVGSPGDELLAVQVRVSSRADVRMVRERVERDAVEALRGALGDPAFRVRVGYDVRIPRGDR